jgi:hypothetical protein
LEIFLLLDVSGTEPYGAKAGVMQAMVMSIAHLVGRVQA